MKTTRSPNTDTVPRNWRTTDQDERDVRRARAAEGRFDVTPVTPAGDPHYHDFKVSSASVAGRAYRVQIRALAEPRNTCECPDFIKNGLGVCKHIEATLARLKRRGARAYRAADAAGSPLVEIEVGADNRVRARWPADRRPAGLEKRLDAFFSASGELLADPADAVPALEREIARLPVALARRVRIGLDARRLAEARRWRRAGEADRAAWRADVAAGKRSGALVRNAKLLDYQIEGALHLAFGRRALLADEMGLGKTIQAIAACLLLRDLRRAERVLVIAPASLKGEWEEQIGRFADAPARVLFGPRAARLAAYRTAPFFTIANYEQVVTDWREINEQLRPDVVVLDEAQRIKNWKTRTAAHIKRLTAPYAFVLTGTPIENRIDEVYSIVEFLEPALFGSLFRFNRDYYELDDRGKPVAVRNLDELQRRLAGVMLRRRKSEIDEALPERTQKNYFVAMHPEQRTRYAEYEEQVSRFAAIAERRPLTPKEQERLQLLLSCMRMICDTPYILDSKCRICPKLDELDALFDEILSEPDSKVIVFSEWVRMLDLVRERLAARGVGFALHTGSIPQAARREEIRRFKHDPACRLFLSSDSGATGLNLQCANVIVNLDLPWNPAKLEQRIARAWRKHQTRPVRVANLVTEDSIESRMLALLAQKRDIARGALDDPALTRIDLGRNREDKLRRLNELLGRETGAPAAAARPAVVSSAAPRPAPPPERAVGEDLAARLGARLVRIERVKPVRAGAPDLLLAVVRDDPDGVARRTVAEVVARNYAPSREPAPAVETLDTATLDLLRRLTDAGLIRPGPALRETLFASDGDPAAEAERRAARRALIAPWRARAIRAADLARLMAKGGFEEESARPWREAFDAATRALHLMARPLLAPDAPVNEQAPLDREALEILWRGVPGVTDDEWRAYAALLAEAPAPIHDAALDHLLDRALAILDRPA